MFTLTYFMVNINITKDQEDYLIKMFELQESFGLSKITSLSKILNYSPGAINDELKRFERMGLIKRIPYKGIVLTNDGLKIAQEATKKHRLAELFLYHVLNVPWDKCHELSMEIEHAIDGPLEEYISKKLKKYDTCPHGNPISYEKFLNEIKLSSVNVNEKFKIKRITFEEKNILSKFKAYGIIPNNFIILIEKTEDGGYIRTSKGKFFLNKDELEIIRVEK